MIQLKFIPIITILLLSAVSCAPKPVAVDTEESFVLSDTMLSTTTTAEVKVEPLRNEISFFGQIVADNNKLIEVYPVVGGNVLSVNVELGDYVQKGQLLATIRSTEVAEYQKEELDAESDVLVAKNNLKVAQELFDGKLNSERDVLEANNQLEKAQSQLNRIKETYKIYHLKDGSIYEVRSPISGFIIQKDINQDMLLRSDHTNNIFDIAEINEVWAIANVSESDITQVKLGVDAYVTTLSYPDKVFKGKVDKIFNVIDPDTKAMKVRVELANSDFMLKPDMRANIKIAYAEDKQMTSIPSSSIIFDKSKNFVMIFKDRNNIETRQIEVCRQVGDVTFISSGLKVGEKVMTHNQLLVYDALND